MWNKKHYHPPSRPKGQSEKYVCTWQKNSISIAFPDDVQKIVVIAFPLVGCIGVSSPSEMGEVRCMHGRSMEGVFRKRGR